MLSGLSVTSIAGVVGVERYAAHIDRLNALSSRCNPFLSAAFLRCYALRAEYHVPGSEERLYLIWEGERLIGIAPLRRSIESVGPSVGPLHWQGVRIGVLAPLDTERPGILAAPEDEARVAAMLINHVCTRERGWGLLEFAGQLPGTPLYEAMHAAENGTFRARDIPVEPYTEIAVVWGDQAAYFRALAKKMRSNISRQARRLFAHGQVEIVLAEGPRAVTAWFEAYCDLDSRSWKNGTDSSIQRHPRRVRFYQEIVAGRAGLEPSFIGIVLDGVLLAGLLNGSNITAVPDRHGTWCLEMAYDESRADLGPGQLLLLLAMGEAIRRGDRFLSFMQNFAYYKQRWGATQVPVVNVQLLRRASLHNVRATIGEWSKKVAAKRAAKLAAMTTPGEAADPAGAAERVGPAEPMGAAAHAGAPDRAVSDTGSAAAERSRALPDLTRARALTAAALAFDGPGIRRLDRHQAAIYLPFPIE